MTTPTILKPDVTFADLAVRQHQIETQALSWPERATAVQIVDQPTYDAGIELLKGIKALRDEAEAHHRPGIQAAHHAHKVAVATLQKVTDPLEEAERLIKGKVGIWAQQQERIRAEAERAAHAEANRLQAEAFERELEAAEAAGAGKEEVAALIEEADRTPVIVPLAQPTYQKAKGISTPIQWSAQVVNMREFVNYIAAHPEHAGLLSVNQPALNALARSMKQNLRMPGVRVNQGTGVSVR
jgi:hypothetical protein